ncbi:MAG: glycoside hydrolase family 78 protein, partial [Promethearchaeota archaeon]
MMKPPFNLRCEYLENPIGIDIAYPRFSWVLKHEKRNQTQTAYQIIVSSEEMLSISGEGNLWDSGKVNSENHINIEYAGAPLKSSSKYYWRVKWWDKGSSESSFSEISTFGIALLEETEWIAKWISKGEFIDKKKRREFQYKSGGRGLFGRLREVKAIY